MSLFTRASAALDRGVVRWMERQMTPRTPHLRASDGARAQLAELAAAYGRAGDAFFPAPEVPAAELTPVGAGPGGTRVVDIAFASDYQPYLPAARESYLAHRENLTAHARWWTSERGRPTIVMIHGWGGGSHWVTERTFAVAYWLRHGYDVAAFVLPFHGVRAPDVRGAMKSGALRSPIWPSPNPLRTNEGFGHAIYDLRALARLLRRDGASAVGAMGMSLGGYTTALWATMPAPGELGFAVAMIPAVDFARLMWRHGGHSPARRRAEQAGIDEDLLAAAFAVHSPVARAPRVGRDGLFVVAGKGDRITPADHAEELARHWGVDVLWFEGGHLAQVGRGEALRTVRRGLGALELPGRIFRG